MGKMNIMPVFDPVEHGLCCLGAPTVCLRSLRPVAKHVMRASRGTVHGCLLTVQACAPQGDASEAKGSQAEAGPYWSLMFEVSESTEKPVNQKMVDLGGAKWAEVVKECVIGALNTKMIAKDDQIVSLYHR